MRRKNIFVFTIAIAILTVAIGVVLRTSPSAKAAPPPPPTVYVAGFAPFSATPAAGVWYEADVRVGGAAAVIDLTGAGGNLETAQPLPVGAARLTTNVTDPAKAEVAVPNNYGVLNDILNDVAVGYSWHKVANPAAGANAFAAPSIKLTFF